MCGMTHAFLDHPQASHRPAQSKCTCNALLRYNLYQLLFSTHAE